MSPTDDGYVTFSLGLRFDRELIGKFAALLEPFEVE